MSDLVPESGAQRLNTRPLFELMVEKRASDLFFTAYAPVKVKIEGHLYPVNRQVLTPEMVRQSLSAIRPRSDLASSTGSVAYRI